MLDKNLLKPVRDRFKRIGDEPISNKDFADLLLDYCDELGDTKYEFYQHVPMLEHGVLDSEEKLRKVFPLSKVEHDKHDIHDLTYKNRHDEFRFNRKPDFKNIEWSMEYTPDHAVEWLKCLDPLYFIKEYCYLKHVSHGFIKFVPRKYQETQIRLMQFERNAVIAMSRQIGKTQTTASFATHFATFNPYKNIAIVAHKPKQAENMLKMIAMTIAALPCWIQPEIVLMSKDRIELANGSVIQAFGSGEDCLRGFQFSMVLCDEAAFIGGFKDTFALTIEPTLSSGDDTKCILFSTPNGSPDINFFAEMFDKAGDFEEGGKDSENTFIRYRVNWDENPENLFYNRGDKGKSRWSQGIRIFKKERVFDGGKWFKSDKLSKNGNSLATFEREYETSFNVSEKTLIDPDVLMSIETVDPHVVPINYRCEGISYTHNINVYRAPLPEERFVMGVDVARGVGRDNSAFVIYSYDKGDVVSTFANNSISIPCYSTLIATAAQYFNNAMIIVELNRDGHLVSNKLESEIKYQYLFQSDLRKGQSENSLRSGIEHNQNKNRGCRSLKEDVETQKFLFSDKWLLDELKSFIEVEDDVFKAVGHTDDLVMACVVMFTARDNSSFYHSMNNYWKDRSKEQDGDSIWIAKTNGIDDYNSDTTHITDPNFGVMGSGSSYTSGSHGFHHNPNSFYHQQQQVYNSMSGWNQPSNQWNWNQCG